jgi:hypothetical protein
MQEPRRGRDDTDAFNWKAILLREEFRWTAPTMFFSCKDRMPILR